MGTVRHDLPLLSRKPLSAFSGNPQLPTFDNTNTVARILFRSQYYLKFARSAVGRLPIAEMLRSHFPFLLRRPSGQSTWS